MKTIILLIALSSVAYAQGSEWRPPQEMLYTSADKHSRALQSLGLTKGMWTLVVVRPGCGDCERAAARINDSPRTVVLVDGDARAWGKKHRLIRARLVESSDSLRSLLGVLWLPTFIRVQNGRISGVRRTAP